MKVCVMCMWKISSTFKSSESCGVNLGHSGIDNAQVSNFNTLEGVAIDLFDPVTVELGAVDDFEIAERFVAQGVDHIVIKDERINRQFTLEGFVVGGADAVLGQIDGMQWLHLRQCCERDTVQWIFSQIEMGQFQGATFHGHDSEDAVALHVQFLQSLEASESVHLQREDVVISQWDRFQRTFHTAEVKALDHIDLVVAQIQHT